MKDTDSLLVFRLRSLRNQPNTCRGRCILYYASLEERPCTRTIVFLIFTLFTMLHTLAFCAMLYACFSDDGECSLTVTTILLPLILLTLYPIVSILIIIPVALYDILKIKEEGLMVWHRDSLGVLIQRLFFSVIILLSMLTFNGCVQDTDHTKQCLVKTGIPLTFVLLIVTLKVLCLRKQRIYLWGGFIICLIAQLIAMATEGSRLFDESDQSDKVAQCLIFLPCALFGLAVDCQIIASTRSYKPIAFSNLPFKGARGCLLALGSASLLMSLATCALCLLIFGGLTSDPSIRRWLYICFIVKAVTWSPFLAMEFYDTLFEQIYHDVQFQINVIKPGGGNSRTASPNQKSGQGAVRRGQKLSTIREQNQQTMMETSSEEDEEEEEESGLRVPLTQQKRNSHNTRTMKPKPAPKLLSGDQSVAQSKCKPADLRSDGNLGDSGRNRLVIHNESGVVQSITDNMGSMDGPNRDERNLSEIERRFRDERRMSSLQNASSSENVNSHEDSRNQKRFSGSDPRTGSITGTQNAPQDPNSWNQAAFGRKGSPMRLGSQHNQPVMNSDNFRIDQNEGLIASNCPQTNAMSQQAASNQVQRDEDEEEAVAAERLSNIKQSLDTKAESDVSLNPASLHASQDHSE